MRKFLSPHVHRAGQRAGLAGFTQDANDLALDEPALLLYDINRRDALRQGDDGLRVHRVGHPQLQNRKPAAQSHLAQRMLEGTVG